MVSKLYVSEYSGTQFQGGNVTSPPQELSTDQVVDFSGGVTASAAFKNNTNLIRLQSDSICSFAFGTAPVATTSNKRLAAGISEFYGVQPGWKVSAITNT